VLGIGERSDELVLAVGAGRDEFDESFKQAALVAQLWGAAVRAG
jgi:hypothetical protein